MLTGVAMVTVLFRRFAHIISLIVALVLIAVPAADATHGGVELDAIGRPSWKPVDCHLFSATIGTLASGYVEYSATLASIL